MGRIWLWNQQGVGKLSEQTVTRSGGRTEGATRDLPLLLYCLLPSLLQYISVLNPFQLAAGSIAFLQSILMLLLPAGGSVIIIFYCLAPYGNHVL